MDNLNGQDMSQQPVVGMPQPIQPEMTQQPGMGMPQMMQPDMTQQPGMGMPQPMQPEMTQQPGMGMPQMMQPDMTQQPGMGMPQMMQPDMTQQPGMGMPQPMQPDMTQQPGMGMPQMMQPDMTQQPGMGMPQPMQPDMTQQPGMGMPQPMQPDMTQQPGMGMPQMMQPDMTQQPGMGMPQMMQPDMTQQPGMGMPQMMQPGMPQQPKAKKPKKQKAPKVKKPMTGGKVAAIIGASIAGIAAVICGIIFIPKFFKPAKDVVVDAFENTFLSGNSGYYIQEKADVNGIYTAFTESGGEMEMVFTINEIMGDTSFKDYTITLTENYDPANYLMNLMLSMEYQGESFMGLNLIGTEDTTYIELVDAIEGYFSVPNDNPLVALEESPLGEELYLYGMPSFSLDYFGTNEGIDAGAVTAGETLWDSVIVEKDGKEKIDVNGNKVKAKKYIVTLEKEDIVSAIEGYMNNLDESVVEQIEYETGMTIPQFTSIITSMISGDLEFQVYIDDDKIVKITTKDSLSIYGMKLEYDIFFDLDDKDMSAGAEFSIMGESMEITIDCDDYATAPTGSFVAVSGNEEIIVDFVTTVEDSDSAEIVNMDISAKFGGTEIAAVEMETNTNKSDDTFTGTMDIYIEDVGDINLEYGGAYTDINKGVSFTQTVDYIDAYYEGEKTASFGVESRIDTSATNAQDVDASYPVYDLTTITSDELYDAIFVDNFESVSDWLDTVINDTGIFGEMVETAIYAIIFSSYDYEEDYEDDYEDYNDDYDYSYTSEECTLVTGDVSVEITGSVNGFAIDYVDQGIYVYYYTDALSSLTYSLEEAESLDEISNGYLTDVEDSIINVDAYSEPAIDQVTLSDGSSATCVNTSYDSYGYKVSRYVVIKEIQPGTYLVADAYIYDDDDSYTLEDIAEAVSSTYYIVH